MSTTGRCQHLLEWFRENGGFFNENIVLVEDEAFGLHFRARKALVSNTEVCICPARLTLSHLNVVGSNAALAAQLGIITVDGDATKLVGRVAEHVISYFVLVEQRFLREQSFWHAYIECLPEESEMTTPLFFSDEDLKWIVGTNLHTSNTDPSRSSVALRRNMWEQEWQEGCDVMRSQGVDVEKYTFELFQWAATIYSSRCFTSALILPSHEPRFSVLFPVLDNANHQFAAKAAWVFKEAAFSLVIEEPVEESAQVYNNYAPKGNEERKPPLPCSPLPAY